MYLKPEMYVRKQRITLISYKSRYINFQLFWWKNNKSPILERVNLSSRAYHSLARYGDPGIIQQDGSIDIEKLKSYVYWIDEDYKNRRPLTIGISGMKEIRELLTQYNQ
jgi:hypothetical protein